MSYIGGSVPRREDPALLRGRGQFVANVVPADAAHVVYVTATVPHALIESIDLDAARTAPGVLGVYCADDIDIVEYPQQFKGMNAAMVRPILARDRVRFVGEPVVAVVAESEARAADAAELVDIAYDVLEAWVDPERCDDAGNHLFPGIADPFAFRTEIGGELDLSTSDVVVTQRLVNPRMSAAPIEPRAGLAWWDGDRLFHVSASQAVHENKAFLASLYDVDPARVRVTSPDVGGSFGAKFRTYPEEALLGWFARRLDRPVVWAETRTASMLGLGPGRGQVQQITIAGSREGIIEQYENRVIQDSGAYPLIGAFLSRQTQHMLTGTYAIDTAAFAGRSVVTNTTPVAAYRGAGRPEATAAIERAVDLFAAECGLDPAEVRLRNVVSPDAFPYTTPSGAVYDSGQYAAVLRRVLDAAGYDELRAEQAERRERGTSPLLGIGLASYVEVTATTPAGDFGSVELLPDGTVVARSSSTPHGQGHATVFTALVADTLGLPIESIDFVAADTDEVPRGIVTGGSRSAQVVGSMLVDAARGLVDRAREIAADLLEAAADDIALDVDTGRFAVAGSPAVDVGWVDVAAATAEEPLAIESDVMPDGQTFPFGAHVAVVEVDPETGGARLVRVVACDDAGPVLHPAIFDGQIHGGLAGGAAQALLEEIRYDADGNPLTTNFADYLVISAAELPSFELLRSETPTPRNLLGVKGVGEAGTVGITAAVQNAVVDAVSHLGVRHIDLPCSPERVWQAIADAATPGSRGESP